MSRVLPALALALAAGCYAPDIPRCAVACGDAGVCPSGLACASDGFCHVQGEPLCGPRFSQLTAGGAHTCAIKDDHTLWCWGRGAMGQTGLGTAENVGAPSQVGGDADWAQVDAAIRHTCAVKLDGSMWCWGDGSSQQLAAEVSAQFAPGRVGADSDWVEAYSNSSTTSCGRKRDGGLYCWGALSSLVRPAAEGTFVSAGHGSDSACAVATDRTLWCWGRSNRGPLGIGEVASATYPPTQVGTRADWAWVGVGYEYACGLDTKGGLWCWGNTQLGSPGTGDDSDHAWVPTAIAAGSSFRRLSVGERAACAITDNGALWCWGRGDSGELGDGGARTRFAPVRVDSAESWMDVSVGSTHSCALRADGTAACWGNNDDGQLGSGALGRSRVPGRVGDDGDWTSVAPGERHACALRADGRLFCFGKNDSGQLGDGSTEQQRRPRLVSGDERWAEVSTGGASTCATTLAGALYCWGNNADGQLGNGASGPYSEKLQPTRVGADVGWSSPAVSTRTACALRSGGLYCWGYIAGVTPTRRGADEDWSVVRGVQSSAFSGLRGAGALWKISVNGALSEQVGVADWQLLRVGATHECGLRPGGVLAARGANAQGQLGLGVDSVSGEGEVPGVWHALGAAPFSTWAIAQDGSLWGFGANAEGGLGGESTRMSEAAPLRIGDGTDWSAVEGGDGFACGVRGAGELWCWGSNSHGQLGDARGGVTRPTSVVDAAPR